MSYILQTALADKLCSLNRGRRFIMWLDLACISNSFYAQPHLLTLDPQSPLLPCSISRSSSYSQTPARAPYHVSGLDPLQGNLPLV